MRKACSRSDVRVTGGVFRERMDLDKRYLLELDSQCLLQNFYLEAGILMPGLQVVSEPEGKRMPSSDTPPAASARPSPSRGQRWAAGGFLTRTEQHERSQSQ